MKYPQRVGALGAAEGGNPHLEAFTSLRRQSMDAFKPHKAENGLEERKLQRPLSLVHRPSY